MTLGPMFSGKTTDLIRRVKRHIIAGQSSVVVSFEGDDRYSAGDEIITHCGLVHGAVKARRLSDILDKLSKYSVVGVDEVQFFDDAVVACNHLVNLGVKVYVCGLSGKSDASPWDVVSNMIPTADSITFLTAVCVNDNCGNDATFTHALHHPEDQSSLIDIGGADKYQACCRRCWMALGV